MLNRLVFLVCGIQILVHTFLFLNLEPDTLTVRLQALIIVLQAIWATVKGS